MAKEKKEEIKLGDSEEKREIIHSNMLDKNTLAVLIVLVALLLIIDFSVAIFYFGNGIDFNWNFGGNNNDSSNGDNNENSNTLTKCNSETLYTGCLDKKPQYCYQGELVNRASICGCPEGYKRDFNDCVRE